MALVLASNANKRKSARAETGSDGKPIERKYEVLTEPDREVDRDVPKRAAQNLFACKFGLPWGELDQWLSEHFDDYISNWRIAPVHVPLLPEDEAKMEEELEASVAAAEKARPSASVAAPAAPAPVGGPDGKPAPYYPVGDNNPHLNLWYKKEPMQQYINAEAMRRRFIARSDGKVVEAEDMEMAPYRVMTAPFIVKKGSLGLCPFQVYKTIIQEGLPLNTDDPSYLVRGWPRVPQRRGPMSVAFAQERALNRTFEREIAAFLVNKGAASPIVEIARALGRGESKYKTWARQLAAQRTHRPMSECRPEVSFDKATNTFVDVGVGSLFAPSHRYMAPMMTGGGVVQGIDIARTKIQKEINYSSMAVMSVEAAQSALQALKDEMRDKKTGQSPADPFEFTTKPLVVQLCVEPREIGGNWTLEFVEREMTPQEQAYYIERNAVVMVLKRDVWQPTNRQLRNKGKVAVEDEYGFNSVIEKVVYIGTVDELKIGHRGYSGRAQAIPEVRRLAVDEDVREAFRMAVAQVRAITNGDAPPGDAIGTPQAGIGVLHDPELLKMDIDELLGGHRKSIGEGDASASTHKRPAETGAVAASPKKARPDRVAESTHGASSGGAVDETGAGEDGAEAERSSAAGEGASRAPTMMFGGQNLLEIDEDAPKSTAAGATQSSVAAPALEPVPDEVATADAIAAAMAADDTETADASGVPHDKQVVDGTASNEHAGHGSTPKKRGTAKRAR
jgi:hypothetical protein